MPAITNLDVSINEAEEQNLRSRDYKRIDVDLNAGAGGNKIYLWYKSLNGAAAITRLQLSFVPEMEGGLINAGFSKINKNLNAGAGGNDIYFWFFKGKTEYDVPIVDISVTTDPDDEGRKFNFSWERLACNLNRWAGGKHIHAWVKREKETYICNVTATASFGSDLDLFQRGYIRVDEDANKAAGGAYVFIWYRQTTDPNRGITDAQISTNVEESQSLQQQGYISVDVNLNKDTAGSPVYLWWIKKEGDDPVQDITLIDHLDVVKPLEDGGVKVIKRNLNTGNCGSVIYLCVYE